MRRRLLIVCLAVAAVPIGVAAVSLHGSAAASGRGGLTIRSSANPSRMGQRIVLTGRLTGRAASGVRVTLWQRLAGQRVFHRVSTTTAKGAGRFTIARRAGAVQTSRQWYVSTAGLKSRIVRQRVRASISLSSSTGSSAQLLSLNETSLALIGSLLTVTLETQNESEL